jgi:hypothetical protein
MKDNKNIITTGRCDTEIMLDILDNLQFSLEPCENEKCRLYDNEISDYARSYDDEIFEESSADSVIEALDTYINDSYVEDLQEEARSYGISNVSHNTSIGQWNDYIESLNKFIEEHRAELEEVAFISDYERVCNVQLSNVVNLQNAKDIAKEIGILNEFQANFDSFKNSYRFLSEAILQSLNKAFLSNDITKNYSVSYDTESGVGSFHFKNSAVNYEMKYSRGLLSYGALNALTNSLMKHAMKNFDNLLDKDQLNCIRDVIKTTLVFKLKNTSMLDIQKIASNCSLSQVSNEVIVPYMKVIQNYIDKDKLQDLTYNYDFSSGNLEIVGDAKHISKPFVGSHELDISEEKDAEALLHYYTYANRYTQNNGKRIKSRTERE